MKTNSDAEAHVPVVDISPFRTDPPGASARGAVAAQVDDVFRRIGFLVIDGHGIDPAVFDRMHRTFEAFFMLPEPARQAVRSQGSGPGYRPLENAALARSRDEDTPPDLSERFLVQGTDIAIEDPGRTAADREWFLANRWPAALPELQEICADYFLQMVTLSRTLLEVFAVALGLEDHYFEDKVDRAISRLNGVHYPPAAARAGQFYAGPHTDYGSFTILHKESGVSGLQVAGPYGGWLDVAPSDGTLIVNVGDLLAEWTNDKWVSTLHRVVPPNDPGLRRQQVSLVFFHQPNYDAIIAPLPSCVSAENPAKHAPVTSGEHLRHKLAKSLGHSEIPTPSRRL